LLAILAKNIAIAIAIIGGKIFQYSLQYFFQASIAMLFAVLYYSSPPPKKKKNF